VLVEIVPIRSAIEGPSWGYPKVVLGAIRSFLEPCCGHLSPKIDQVSEELTLRYPPERPCVGSDISTEYSNQICCEAPSCISCASLTQNLLPTLEMCSGSEAGSYSRLLEFESLNSRLERFGVSGFRLWFSSCILMCYMREEKACDVPQERALILS